jgi:hypothetical protein
LGIHLPAGRRIVDARNPRRHIRQNRGGATDKVKISPRVAERPVSAFAQIAKSAGFNKATTKAA